MFRKNINFRKAAVLFAAFFIFSPAVVYPKTTSETLDSAKKKTTSLLAQKQKSEAIQVLQEYLKNETIKSVRSDAGALLVKISQTFISKEAQEAYEASVNATLESSKDSSRYAEICLQLEPTNIDCLIQKMRLSYREKNISATEKYLEDISKFAGGTDFFLWLDLVVHKDASSTNFKNRNFIKKINEKPSEEFFVLTTLEIERAIGAKNFSRAKEGVDYLEKNYPDYPDSIFFKQKIDSESAEEKLTNAAETNMMYSAKCKSLTKSMARKFRYDFDLCQRGPQ